MAIIVNLDVMLARRKMRSKELAGLIGITEQNLSLLKLGKVKGIRFSTLENICEKLNCQPGDILEYQPDKLGEEQNGKREQTDEDDGVQRFIGAGIASPWHIECACSVVGVRPHSAHATLSLLRAFFTDFVGSNAILTQSLPILTDPPQIGATPG